MAPIEEVRRQEVLSDNPVVLGVDQVTHGASLTVKQSPGVILAEGGSFFLKCAGLALLVASIRMVGAKPSSVHLMCSLVRFQKLTRLRQKRLQDELSNCVREGLLDYLDVDNEQTVIIKELTRYLNKFSCFFI